MIDSSALESTLYLQELGKNMSKFIEQNERKKRGAAIKERLKAHGITQREFAEALGITTNFYNAVLNGSKIKRSVRWITASEYLLDQLDKMDLSSE